MFVKKAVSAYWRLAVYSAVIGIVVSVVDMVYHVSRGYFIVNSFLSSLDYLAVNAVANAALCLFLATVIYVPIVIISFVGRKEEPASGSHLARITWFVFFSAFYFILSLNVNIDYLPGTYSAESLIGNLVLVALFFALAIFSTIKSPRFFGFVLRKGFYIPSAVVAVPLVIIFLGFLAFYSGGKIQENPRIEGPNVIIITIDALRQDRVGAYGLGYVETPNLDGFAAKSVRFEEACTPAPWTIPSMYSMNSSRYPSVHGVDLYHRGSEKIIMLAQVLKSHGYRTEGYVANNLLYSERGFGRGFDVYVEQGDIGALVPVKLTAFYRFMCRFRNVASKLLGKPGPDTTKWLTDRLVSAFTRYGESNRRRPLFLWAHYLDPHHPLTPPREYIHGEPELIERALDRTYYYVKINETFEGNERELYVPLYEAEVRYVDDELERVFKAMEEAGIFDDSLIIITADHGEEFNEHGRYGHCWTHYDEVMSIPMMIYAPDVEPGVSGYPASLMDIMPTVLDYVGAYEPPGMSGESLIPAMETAAGGEVPDTGKYIYLDQTAYNPYMKSVRLWPYTLTRDGEKEYSYVMIDNSIHEGPDDIVQDPDSELFDRMRTALDRWAELTAAETEAVGDRIEIGLDEEQKERLKNLGYLD
jgi:arylsulfatase A-like enzyme